MMQPLKIIRIHHKKTLISFLQLATRDAGARANDLLPSSSLFRFGKTQKIPFSAGEVYCSAGLSGLSQRFHHF